MSSGEYSTYQFFPNDMNEPVARFVDVEEAMRIARICCTSLGAKMGTTTKVMITDGGDCCVFEWQYGKGIVWPKELEGKQWPT